MANVLATFGLSESLCSSSVAAAFLMVLFFVELAEARVRVQLLLRCVSFYVVFICLI